MNDLKITVNETAGVNAVRPVTGGAPLPKGAAPRGSVFDLHDEAGRSVPLQTTVLGQWEDGSARWVLLDFQSDPPADGAAHYTLRCDSKDKRATHELPVVVKQGVSPLLSSGNLTLKPAKNGLISISDGITVSLTAKGSAGEDYNGIVESVSVQTSGESRSTLELRGSLKTASGERLFSFRLWASLFAGLSKVLIEPLILVDAEKGLIQRIRELCLEVTPAGGVKTGRIGGEPGWSGRAQANARLMQVDDRQYTLDEKTGSRAPGWAEIGDGKDTIAVAVRDFWRQWPKSLETGPKSLRIGLLPSFKAGAFAHMEPWYKFDYLFENDSYRLRTGQARRWQVWIDLEGDGDSLAKHANAPLVPAADPTQAVATGLWGDIVAAGGPGMAEYDKWADDQFGSFKAAIESHRDYGAMNWGDWFGERVVNWGNNEYDTPRQMLVQFARTGNPDYLHWGSAAARHMSEVDTIQAVNDDLRAWFGEKPDEDPIYPIAPGLMHQHAVGHVGGFHSRDKINELFVSFRVGDTDKPYLCLDPYNLGHMYTQGMVYHYFLTGDPWVRETVETIGASLARLVEGRRFAFKSNSHCGRVNGWTALALAGAYELGFDKRYLNAMKLLADDALSEQDPHSGGWLYELVWGHCCCQKRKHVGEAGFINAVRLNGLYRYYRLTADERIPEAVKRGISFLNEDTWKDERGGWRYTSCPASPMSGQPGVTMLALASCVSLHNDPEHRRILTKAWATLFEKLKKNKASGKAFSSTLYGCPEAVGVLQKGNDGSR